MQDKTFITFSHYVKKVNTNLSKVRGRGHGPVLKQHPPDPQEHHSLRRPTVQTNKQRHPPCKTSTTGSLPIKTLFPLQKNCPPRIKMIAENPELLNYLNVAHIPLRQYPK